MSIVEVSPYIKCVPGQKLTTWLPVTFPGSTALPDGEEAKIPLIVVNGIKEGPRIGFFGAIHGDELEGVQAIWRIAEELDPKKMKGAFLGIPVVNPSGYWNRVRNNPDDNVNINRVFPGNMEGTVSRRIAYTIYEYIIYQIACIVDYHAMGSRALAVNTVHIRHYANRTLWEKTSEIASICGFKYVSVIPEGIANGMLDDINARDPEHGIPYVSTEMSGVGAAYAGLDERINMCIQLGFNIMKYYDIVPGEPDIPEPPRFTIAGEWPTKSQPGPDFTRAGGWMKPYVTPGQEVEAGQKLADLFDMFGDVSDSTHAPFDGIVRVMSSYPIIPANSVPIQVMRLVTEAELKR